MIGGDSVQDGQIFMFGVQRQMQAYIHSLARLEEYRDAFDWVYPSHGSFPVGPELIPALRAAAGEVLRGEVQGTECEMHGRKVMRYDVGVAAFLGEA